MYHYVADAYMYYFTTQKSYCDLLSALQKSDKLPQEVTASDTGDMANGSHPEADEETSAEAEQVDEATEAKRQLLVKAAPLAGIWALERFGLADVTVLKLIEALPGGLMTGCERQSALGLCF